MFNRKSTLIERLLDNLLDFGKSELLQGAKHITQKSSELLDILETKFPSGGASVEDFAESISPLIDKEIIKSMANNPMLKPIAGEFSLSKDPKSDNILAVWEFYFINSQKQYIKIGSEKVFDRIIFNDNAYLTITNTSQKFDIEPPK